MSKHKFICEIALSLGKTKQDLANWRFNGKVPKIMRFDIFDYARKDGIELTRKDFEKFGK